MSDSVRLTRAELARLAELRREELLERFPYGDPGNDDAHRDVCDWNLYREYRDTDPDLCNLGCLDE